MSTISSAMISNSLPLPESSASARPLSKPANKQDATSVAQDFESVFASMVLKEMRQSLEPGSLFGEDSGDVYGGLFDRFMGEELTQGRGLGMAPMIREGIERQQHSANHSHAAPAQPSNAALKIGG